MYPPAAVKKGLALDPKSPRKRAFVIREYSTDVRPAFRGPALPAALLFLVLGLTILALWPGIRGGFLFDDYFNLAGLGKVGAVHDWETLKAYLSDGSAGPTGRPLALLSFLIDSNTWPAPATPFKYTNLMLHLLCGVFLVWSGLQLCRLYGLPERQAQYFALFNAAAWLLHPYLLSTTFYVVQRMAILAALFCFAGMTAYLHGRLLYRVRPKAGLIWMGAGLAGSTLLATLSKENGALLPLLILMVEFCRPRGTTPLPRWFRTLFLYVPAAAIVVFLATRIDFSPSPWPARDFNQPERLLTEARILWEYLGNLIGPRIEGAGLYQEGRTVSRGWLSPPTTLVAMVGLTVLLGASIGLRRRFPLLSLAILFFLAGHLLESSLIGLELYFEHRNYLPAAFLFFPIIQGISALPLESTRWMRPTLAFMLLAVLAFLSHQRALLWGDPVGLKLYWAVAAPNSPRARNTLAHYYLQHGEARKALEELRTARERLPQSALLTVSELLTKVRIGIARHEDFVQAARDLGNQSVDGQSITGLREIVNIAVTHGDDTRLGSEVLALISHLKQHTAYAQIPFARRLLLYLEARLLLAQHAYAEAEEKYREAMGAYGDIDSALQMVAELAIAGRYEAALRLLDTAQEVYSRQPPNTLRYPASYYEREIPQLRQKLRQAIATPPSSSDNG